MSGFAFGGAIPDEHLESFRESFEENIVRIVFVQRLLGAGHLGISW
jgi:hypothetical protein